MVCAMPSRLNRSSAQKRTQSNFCFAASSNSAANCFRFERCKIHDLLIECVELALKKRGYPALADMKTKWRRKGR
jgi:hypothetical protein